MKNSFPTDFEQLTGHKWKDQNWIFLHFSWFHVTSFLFRLNSVTYEAQWLHQQTIYTSITLVQVENAEMRFFNMFTKNISHSSYLWTFRLSFCQFRVCPTPWLHHEISSWWMNEMEKSFAVLRVGKCGKM